MREGNEKGRGNGVGEGEGGRGRQMEGNETDDKGSVSNSRRKIGSRAARIARVFQYCNFVFHPDID